jgi:hypothetical protein
MVSVGFRSLTIFTPFCPLTDFFLYFLQQLLELWDFTLNLNHIIRRDLI